VKTALGVSAAGGSLDLAAAVPADEGGFFLCLPITEEPLPADGGGAN
jgi:hypothetical protein